MKPMTIDRFRKWKAAGRNMIPWGEIEATVIELAALEQLVRDSDGSVLKRVLRVETVLADLDTRTRLVLADLRGATTEGLKEAVEAAIRDMHEALNRVAQVRVSTGEKR